MSHSPHSSTGLRTRGVRVRHRNGPEVVRERWFLVFQQNHTALT